MADEENLEAEGMATEDTSKPKAVGVHWFNFTSCKLNQLSVKLDIFN